MVVAHPFVHPRPFYYLENFQTALGWLARRYDDLLSAEEREFMATFAALPMASSALLVRMIMRKGDLFRSTRLDYAEIGCPHAAAAPLVRLGWLDDRPMLGLVELFALLRKAELAVVFRLTARERGLPKPDLFAHLSESFIERRTFEAWDVASESASEDRVRPSAPNPSLAEGTSAFTGATCECVYRVRILPLCERLRLMFFGNFDQVWSEFVLADLGIFQYEKVSLPPEARAFQSRQHIDDFHAIYRCRDRFHRDEPTEAVLEDLPRAINDNPWLESRRTKLLFQLAQRHEKQGELDAALTLYSTCAHPGARVRAIRVLERTDQWAQAAQLARAAEQTPESEVERQLVTRMLPRLHKRIGEPAPATRRPSGWETFHLRVPQPSDDSPVELATRDFLTQPEAPVHYVENALINSLFGLLCWDVVFKPLPGAFFHEFHSAPADIDSPDFFARRERDFRARFEQLTTGEYRDTILKMFALKAGIQSAFVSWGWMTEDLISAALDCLPPKHLEHCFHRIVRDVKTNRAGFPDLIQFWPRERRYRMIEVKGPGDRLQDNQIRWLDYCASHGMPVSVCHVRWAEGAH